MSKYKWLLDAGHGGIDPSTGKYVTAPNKMYKFPDGLTIYEGVLNRQIQSELIELLKQDKIDYVPIADEWKDTPLKDRVYRTNITAKQSKTPCIFLSIHCNAGKGSGWEVYTTKGQNNSDKVASVFYDNMKKEFTDKKFRADVSDGDMDKEEHFYVIAGANCPAILTENFFFDNEEDVKILNSTEGIKRIAHGLYEAIKQIETNGIK